MSQPTKEQLILEWEIATNEAMAVLAAWAKQLETWRLSGQTVPDEEFMAAYANLANNLGDWPDWAVKIPYGVDNLREALTGVDLSQPGEPMDDFEVELRDRIFDTPEDEGFSLGIDPVLWAEETESEYI